MVRVLGDPPYVRIFAPVLANVERNPSVAARINELNEKIQFARLFETDGTIFAAVEVFGSPFVGEHVAHACWILGKLADDIDEALQEEFGGRTAFGQFRSTARKGGAEPGAVEGPGAADRSPRPIGFAPTT
jgi:hypothetical protein